MNTAEGPSYGAIADVVDAVNARITTQGYPTQIILGNEWLEQNDDPNQSGGVVIAVPVDSPLLPPPMEGQATFIGGDIALAVQQQLDVYIWARAAATTDPTQQYKADLRLVEQLRDQILDSFTALIPGAQQGGRVKFPKRASNEFGTLIVMTLTVQIDSHAQAYGTATPPFTSQLNASISPDGESA